MEQLIIDRLLSNGFECFLVGGAVRDSLLSKVAKDKDFATNATPEQLNNLFKDQKIVTKGKNFKVTIINGIEVATYRKDMQSVLYNAKHCKPVYAKTIDIDLLRRDLTINAMAIDMSRPFDFTDNSFVDPFDGYEDLMNGIIRFVGNPQKRIEEDPLRIIRACRFLAAIEGSFDPYTLRVLQDNVYLIKKYVAPERVSKEILKAMEIDTPSLFFSALHLIGALKYIFPSMDTCFNHEHGKYHKETVGEHILQAGDNIAKKFPLLRLAAFLHDVGKPIAFKQQGDGSFIHHEHIGYKIVEKEMKHLCFSNNDIKYVINLIRMHMRQCRSLTKPAIRRLQKSLADHNVNPKDFIRLKIADRTANVTKDKTRFTPVKELLINAGIKYAEEEVPFTVKALALSGGEIIDHFNLKPGPEIGRIQRFLLNKVLDKGETINNKETLLTLTKEYLCGS